MGKIHITRIGVPVFFPHEVGKGKVNVGSFLGSTNMCGHFVRDGKLIERNDFRKHVRGHCITWDGTEYSSTWYIPSMRLVNQLDE